MTSGRDADESSQRLLFLRERFAWMGRHSGYDVLFQKLAERWPGETETVWRERGHLFGKLLKPVELRSPRIPFYNGDSLAAEWALLRAVRMRGARLAHIAYVENNLRHIALKGRRDDLGLVGTAHQPVAFWRERHRHPELVQTLDALIVMCRDQQDYFESLLPGAVHFIPHGVDAHFFCPAESVEAASVEGEARCVFSGTWLRDLAALRVVVEKVCARCPHVRFDFIVPRDKRRDPDLERLSQRSEIRWHADLTDEALRNVYRGARLLLLPFIDATANNALVEAMACGLPVVASNVPGIRDYTTEAFATRPDVGDVEGLTAAVVELVEDAEGARVRGRAARAHAVAELDWEIAAERTLRVYRSVRTRTEGPS